MKLETNRMALVGDEVEVQASRRFQIVDTHTHTCCVEQIARKVYFSSAKTTIYHRLPIIFCCTQPAPAAAFSTAPLKSCGKISQEGRRGSTEWRRGGAQNQEQYLLCTHKCRLGCGWYIQNRYYACTEPPCV